MSNVFPELPEDFDDLYDQEFDDHMADLRHLDGEDGNLFDADDDFDSNFPEGF